MKNWKKIALGAASLSGAILVGLGVSTQSSAVTSARNPSLTVPAAIQTLDQSLVTDSYSNIVIGNTESGLVRTINNKPVLDLAKSIDVSSDGLTYTITLRDGLKWSNGDALTAKDFVYSWQRAVDPKTASEYEYMMTYVKNADEINSGKITDLSQLGIKADSDTKLTVTLKSPASFFKQVLALSVYFPEDQKVVEQYGKEYATSSDKTVYSGPFMFKQGQKNGWSGSNKTYDLVKNPGYWNAKNVIAKGINLQVVTDATQSWNLYKTGKIDATSIASPALYKAHKKDKGVVNVPLSENHYLEFNQSGKGTSSDIASKALQNINIRKAIILATNRQGLINAVTPVNKVAYSFTPINSGLAPNGKDFSVVAKQSIYKYDTTQAKKYWKQGLQELGVSKLNLSLEIDSDSATGKDSASFLKKNFEADLPGLTVTLKLVPFAQRLQDSTNGNFDIVGTLWGADYQEPSTYLNLFVAGSQQNNGKFVNADFQAAMDKAAGQDATNPTKQYDDYKAAEKALADKANVDPIEMYAGASEQNAKLKGLVRNAVGTTLDFSKTYISK
ncbi:peptide ABC transporter substrate-binding protein [Lactovum miscens]|uniref:Oligopeptide transport system substrate-binding protein n=1 Tax=Lactovum miscens TaxID=190387 RepID=A0A841C4V2_9LACT|nr:peptide ABC transporter substrate-binding protein [Lactovum miscens]MBB5887455.1 oligopeptide transport system substrate-binding protein [Lactovum miscens]